MKKFLFLLLPLFFWITPAFADATTTCNVAATNVSLTSQQYWYNTSTTLNQTGPFSYEAWFYSGSLGSTNVRRWIVGDRLSSNAVGESAIWINGNTDVTGGANDIEAHTYAASGGFLYLDSGVKVVTNTWYHVAFVATPPNSWNLYVNGVLKATSTASRTLSNASKAGIAIGAGDEGTSGVGNYFDGNIDEVRLWNIALTTAQITSTYNYNQELVGNESGLIGYWKFNNTPSDTTANAFNLTSVNAPNYTFTVPFAGTCTVPGGATTTIGAISVGIDDFTNNYYSQLIYVGAGFLVLVILLGIIEILRNLRIEFDKW